MKTRIAFFTENDSGDITHIHGASDNAQALIIGTIDNDGKVSGMVGPDGAPVVSHSTVVSASRAIVKTDFDKVLKCASGITMTIPADATLEITDDSYSPTLNFYQAGASAVVLSTAGLTIRGTQRNISQYGIFGIMRVGANEWAYL